MTGSWVLGLGLQVYHKRDCKFYITIQKIFVPVHLQTTSSVHLKVVVLFITATKVYLREYTEI